MPRVMAVTFEQYGRLHYLDPDGADYRVGDRVLYPTDDGAEVACVVWVSSPRRPRRTVTVMGKKTMKAHRTTTGAVP